MSVFPVTHTERLAPGSFQQPVPIPASLPGDSPLVQVCFNRDWLPYLLGCLFQLTLVTTWQTSDDDQLQQILGEANNLILIFQQATPGCSTANLGSSGASEDYMLRQNPDNPCELQSSVDGVTWCTWADLSKCIQGTQPGIGAPQPPSGECQEFPGTITPLIRWLLPVPVSTGDQVTISNLFGSWSPIASVPTWYCPDGNIYFAGACIDGTSTTDSRDPMPSAPLFGTVAFDGTNYYDVSAAANPGPGVTITIAAGITKRNLVILCNTYTALEPGGEITFLAKVCNNQPASWIATLDFTRDTYSFVTFAEGDTPGFLGHWVAGVGWQNTDGHFATGESRRGIVIHRAVSFQCTRMILTLDYALGGSDVAGDEAQQMYTGAVNLFNKLFSSPPITGTNIQYDSGPVNVAVTDIFLRGTTDRNSGGSGGFTGSDTFISLQIQGTGPNPFAL